MKYILNQYIVFLSFRKSFVTKSFILRHRHYSTVLLFSTPQNYFFYFLPRIKISRIFVQVCPVILSQISGLFCARFTKLPTPTPENSAFCLDILHGTALYLCRKETPGMKMHGYVFFCPEVPVFAGFRYRSRQRSR